MVAAAGSILQPTAQPKGAQANLRQEQGAAQRQQHHPCAVVVFRSGPEVQRAVCDELGDHEGVLERTQRQRRAERGRMELCVVPDGVGLGRVNEFA